MLLIGLSPWLSLGSLAADALDSPMERGGPAHSGETPGAGT
jgi:hypothetical protein